ncbi:MAG: hypothetical protein ABW224_16030 [Kibdelosporangium sp.]
MNLDPVRARLVRRFGEDVNEWVDQAAERVADLAARWHVRPVEPYPHGNSSLAIRCGHAVLKLSPDVEFLDEQVRIMRLLERSRRVPAVLVSSTATPRRSSKGSKSVVST